MKLADARKIAIRKQTRIRFPLKNGMECVIDGRGVALVPALKEPPDFNLEDEFAGAATFTMEPIAAPGARNTPKPTTIAREALAGMTGEHGGAAEAHDEHEDE